MEFTSIKGFRDILPQETGTWQRLEAAVRYIFALYGFQEIKPPIMEWTELFRRSIGQDTDIVSKEMYTLRDSKGRGMTLRPEATASVVRAYIQNRLYLQNPIQKLYLIGPMFRHERPQKGRFRQFHQINAEIIGDPGPRSDADLILMLMFLLETVGLSDLTLHLNSLGCPACRPGFREELNRFLAEKTEDLCADCQRRAETNPLRVFDCKVERCNRAVTDAPAILDFICRDCGEHLDGLRGYLEEAGVPYLLNPRLMRGLDYYTRTTFEVQTQSLGAQSAVVGGGRYDALCKQIGGPDHPAIGFAIGMERLVSLMEALGEREIRSPDFFMIALGEKAEKSVFQWAQALRRDGYWVEMAYVPGGLKAQMKKADRLGTKKVFIVGEDEIASGKGILRNMETGEQREVPLDNVVQNLKDAVGP